MRTKNGQTETDLVELAKAAMLDRGFYAEFPDEVLQEVGAMTSPAPAYPLPDFMDMRTKLWISIDNDDSKDLDQLTYAEVTPEGKERIFVAVADVDALIKKDSPSDKYAYNNTTSVYTPEVIFSMLHPRFSTDLTSLNPDVDRCAVIIESEVDKKGSSPLSRCA